MAKQGITNVIKVGSEVADAIRESAKLENDAANLKLSKELAEAKAEIIALRNEASQLNADLLTSAAQAERFSQQLAQAKLELKETSNELENFKFGSGISEMEEALERFKSNASASRAEFEAFLKVSHIDVDLLEESGHWTQADQIRTWTEQIEEGAMTANQAISSVKATMTSWMDQSGGDGLFDAEQVQTFVAQLNNVSSGIDSIMAKLRELEANGIKTIGDAAGGNGGADLTNVLSSIEQAANNMAPEVKEAYNVITELLSAINQYANIDTNKMLGTLSTFEAVAKIGQGSFGKRSVDNLIHLATTLRTLQDGSNGVLRFDFSGLDQLQSVLTAQGGGSKSTTALKNLATYLPAIANINVDKLKQLSQIDFSNFKNLQVGKSAVETVANLATVLNSFAASQKAIAKAAKSSDKKANSELQKYIDARQRMQNQLGSNTTPEFQRFSDLIDKVKAGGSGFEDLGSYAIDAKHSIDQLNKSMKETEAIQKNFNLNAAILQDPARVESLRRGIDAQTNADPALQARAHEALNAALTHLQQALAGDVNEQKALNEAMREFYSLQKAVYGDSGAMKGILTQQKSIAQLRNELAQYMRENERALMRNPALKKRVEDLYGQASAPDAYKNSDRLKADWETVRGYAQSAGTEVETTTQRLSRLFTTHFNTGIIMAALNGLRVALRQLWTDIKDVNEALVQTQVVTGLTGAALENYTERAYQAASRSKDTVTNILESATAYGRLGYDSEISVDLAELTSMYAKLGDTDVSSATDAITAMMKAFDLSSADEIEVALDKLIYVGNNFPISASGLGEGLNNAASALASAGNSLEETLSLLMAANATVQNPAKASTAMRTITARIRNSSAELGELGETLEAEYDTVAKYRDKLLGVSGVDILDKTGQEFRSTYDIIKDLAAVWATLNSTQQATITTMLAGTRNQDIFASLMKNFPSAIDAINGMDDAAGLMDQKFVAVSESISGALSELSNAFSKFSTNLINSKDVTTAINALTKLVEVLDNLRGMYGTGGLAAALAGIPLMLRNLSKMNFGEYREIAGSLGDMSQWSTAIDRMRVLDPLQRQTIVNLSSMDSAQKALFIDMAKTENVTMGAAGAFGTLQASLQSARMGLQNFIASGNGWIMLAQLVIMVISRIVQMQKTAQEETKRLATQQQQAAADNIRNVNSVAEEYKSASSDVDNYIARIRNLSDALSEDNAGTKKYYDAKAELFNINSQIVSQFGEEANVIENVSSNLDTYAEKLEKISRRKVWNELNSQENDAGLRAMLDLYGLNRDGSKKSGGMKPITVDTNIEFAFDTTKRPKIEGGMIVGNEFGQTHQEYLESIVGQEIAQYLDWFGSTNWNITGSDFGIDRVHMTGNLSTLEFKDANSAIELIQKLEERWIALKEAGSDAAPIVSQMIDAIKGAVNYSQAVSLHNTWMEGFLEFGIDNQTIQDGYNALVTSRDQIADLVSEGQNTEAAYLLDQWNDNVDALINTAYQNGYDQVAEYLRGMQSAFNRSGDVVALLRQLSVGGNVDLANRKKVNASVLREKGWDVGGYGPISPDDYATVFSSTFSNEDGTVAINFTPILPNGEVLSPQELAEYAEEVINGAQDYLGLKIGGVYGSIEDAEQAAIAAHLASEGFYQFGQGAPSGYNPNAATVYETYHKNGDTGLVTTDAFSATSISDQTDPIAKIKEYGENLYNAKKALEAVTKAYDEGKEAAEDDIKAIKEFTGDTFEEIDEATLDALQTTLDEGDDKFNTGVESMFNNAIQWVEKNGDEFGINVFDYINDDGTWDISGLLAELQSKGQELSSKAGAVGAMNGLAYVSGLQSTGQATITSAIVQGADGLTSLVTKFQGGGGGSTPPPKGGGGGGGKKSKLSKAYQSDIDALERIIELFRNLLNYYEEGSDQWIARQTSIIDKYKAGVAIAMDEYKRLRKKGLKETDEDVKTVVDAILEYQDNIYKESENLWEAVRQNQIDAIQHTKDQNDAAIQLEETHHDLLISIRNERRELEDELQAARNAYSEVMTPQELDALFSIEDYADLMDKLSTIEGDALSMYEQYRAEIAGVTEDETYMIEHITDEFERQYELKMKEYEIAKAELGVARAQQELENVRNEQTVMMLKDGMWQWVADPEKVLEAERKLAEAQQELSDAQESFNFESLVNQMEANSSELQRQIDALKALTFSMDNLANQIHLFSDKVYKELLSYLSTISQQYFKKYEGSTAVPAFASGGVIARGGLAEVHSGEPIFGTEDAVKLWKFVHNLTPNDISTAQTMAGINRMAVGNMNGAVATNANSMIDNSVTINGMRVDGDNAQALIAIMRQVVASYQPITN